MAKERRSILAAENTQTQKVELKVRAATDDIVTAGGKEIELPAGCVARLVVSEAEAAEIRKNKNLEVKKYGI